MPRDTAQFAAGSLTRSPSGLFTRRAWERDLEASYERMPSWYWSGAESDRQFALWVHAQAKTLAAQLDRLVQPDTGESLTERIEGLADLLWSDAEWARRHADGSLSGAA